jgi:RsiW-degrading membrane proteinase PrsW (M82 family)
VSFLIIAPIEELAKYVAVKRWVYKSMEFDEVMDGIVYTVAVSLGFATVENIFYVVTQGVEIGIARAFLAVPGHAFFGALMGFYIGLAKFDKEKEIQLLTKGVVFAIIAHGLYDFLILTKTAFAALAVVLIIILGLWVRRELKKAEILSAQRIQEEKNKTAQTTS